MADKTKNATVTETATEATETTEVKKPRTVMVKLPLLREHNAEQDVYVSVNFKSYIIRRGEFVEIPEEVKEVLENSEHALDAAFKYADEKKLREA